MGALGEQHRNGRYVEKGAAGHGLELLAGEPGRQDAYALERMPQGESRHGNSVQSIPHSAKRGAGDAGMADLILRAGYRSSRSMTSSLLQWRPQRLQVQRKAWPAGGAVTVAGELIRYPFTSRNAPNRGRALGRPAGAGISRCPVAVGPVIT